MKRTVMLPVIMLLLVSGTTQDLSPCTTFCFQAQGQWVYGRNYDWDVEHALVVVNRRGVAKRGFTLGKTAQWVAKFGSVTINQYGREFPLGGMNEAGLVVECMWLEATEYPHVDDRPEVNTLQWIQYQLDTADSVAAVAAGIDRIRISPQYAQPLHFLLCDASGASAVVEFLEGESRVYTGLQLPVTVLTNSTFRHSLNLLNMLGSGEDAPAFRQASMSLKRFVRAARGVRAWPGKNSVDPVKYTFELLDEVAMDRTVFRVVYDPGHKRIHFLTRAHPERRVVRVDAFDYACESPTYFLDMADPLKGDVTRAFKPMTTADNLALVRKSFAETSFLKDTPQAVLTMLAGFPDSLACAGDREN